MARIYLIRHAESTRNAHGITVQGNRDVPITDKGISQAKQISGYVDTIICSPLQRARQTLENSNLKYNNVIYSDFCREIMDSCHPNHLEHEELFTESEEQIQQRIADLKSLVTELVNKDDNKTVAILSHSYFIYRMTGISMHNCQVMEYDLLN